jgi:hypothetical protein
MNTGDTIQYFQREEIDNFKWDQCIDNSSNGLVYGYSYYLDCMSKQWDALVMGDYAAVMPLTWNKKYGICYLYQPAFTASLGVFGNNLDQEVVTRFIRAIPAKFRLTEIALNSGNYFNDPEAMPTLRTNFILPLNKDYQSIYSNYKENVRRNIKKAMQLGCRTETGIPLDGIVELSKPAMKSLTGVSDDDYRHFGELYRLLHERKQALTYGVYAHNNQLVASCVYFFSHKRSYYILVGNHPNGKVMGASHWLIDCFIRDHAGQDLILDFEGSDLRNLAFFYGSFGSTTELYPFLKLNDLPFFMKWMKR